MVHNISYWIQQCASTPTRAIVVYTYTYTHSHLDQAPSRPVAPQSDPKIHCACVRVFVRVYECAVTFIPLSPAPSLTLFIHPQKSSAHLSCRSGAYVYESCKCHELSESFTYHDFNESSKRHEPNKSPKTHELNEPSQSGAKRHLYACMCVWVIHLTKSIVI